MTAVRRFAPFVVILLAACAARERPLERASPATDEIWIVARSGERLGRTGGTAGRTGVPRMLAGPNADAPPLALERTEVEGTVVGPYAAVHMRQTYAGPDTATEGTFVLPLRPRAVLQDFVLTIGSRHIRAVVRPREEAEALYASALRSGHAASLLREESGVALGLARLPARTPIEVELAYADEIPWRDGAWELVVPRVPTGVVGATIDFDALGPISTVVSPTHAIERADAGEGRARITLREPATLHDADLVLRYAVAADARAGGGAVVTSGTRGSVVLVVLHPMVRGGVPVGIAVDAIDWGTLAVEGSPRRMRVVGGSPDGCPFVLAGRVIGGTPGVVRVTTMQGGRRALATLPVRTAPAGVADALSVLVASAEVRTLADDPVARRAVALRYGLVSPETALVAIDATAPNR